MSLVLVSFYIESVLFNMPLVFGRNFKNPHPFDSAIAEWMDSQDPVLQALAFNLMYDHRVSEDREGMLIELSDHVPNSSELNEIIVSYFYKYIRHNSSPHFASETINGNNFLYVAPSIYDKILSIKYWLNRIRRRLSVQFRHKSSRSLHEDPASYKTCSEFNYETYLARIIDLNGLGNVFQSAKDRGMREFERFPGIENITDWLDDNLGRSEDQSADFIKTVLNAIKQHRRIIPFQPSWATLWSDFEEFALENADRWLEVLGLYKVEPNRWLIVLKYTCGEAGKIVMATQLDAGWWPYYFPSPPQARLGHCMNIGATLSGTIPLSEFIHKQIDHSFRHWDNAGRLCKRTTRPSHLDLPNQRSAHYQSLVNLYGKESAEGWLSNS